jgi:hypothetical protein
MRPNHYNNIVEKLTSFFAEEGFVIPETSFRKEFITFEHIYDEAPENRYFCILCYRTAKSNVYLKFGVKLKEMEKYIKHIGGYTGDVAETLFFFDEFVRDYDLDDEAMAKQAFIGLQSTYYDWALPFFKQNASPKGVFESLRITGSDRSYPTYYTMKKGCYYTNFNSRELDLFLTKVFNPNEIEDRINFFIAEAAKYREFLKTKGVPIEPNSENRLIAHLNEILAKIETIDIDTARKELIY